MPHIYIIEFLIPLSCLVFNGLAYLLKTDAEKKFIYIPVNGWLGVFTYAWFVIMAIGSIISLATSVNNEMLQFIFGSWFSYINIFSVYKRQKGAQKMKKAERNGVSL